MAVELHRTSRELFPSSPLHEFQSENDVVSFVGLDGFSALGSDQSELASSETESSDCMAELTRDVNIRDKVVTKEPWDFGGWPCTTGIWSPFGSSYGSAEEGSSREETPPTTPAIEKRHAVWDKSGWKHGTTNVITANMEKLNINKADENSAELPKHPPIGDARFRQQNQATTTVDHQIRAIQLFKLKQELLLKQQRLGNNKSNQYEHHIDQLLESSEKNHVQFDRKKLERARQPARKWANQQQHQQTCGSGMRAVFLNGPGLRTGPPCGTGVFLPSVTGDTSRTRKNKGCSPVLIPAKVMQALKDHFDRMDNLPRQNNSVNFPMQRGNITHNYSPKNNSQKKRQSRTAAPATNQNDMGLPQDWTY